MKPFLEIEQLEDLLVCRLTGEFTSHLLDQIREEIVRRVHDAGVFRVLFNLAGVEYITSKDLGVFVQVFRFLDSKAKEQDIPGEPMLALSDLSPFVQDVIEMTKLESVFRVFGSEAEALAALTSGSQSPQTPS